MPDVFTKSLNETMADMTSGSDDQEFVGTHKLR